MSGPEMIKPVNEIKFCFKVFWPVYFSAAFAGCNYIFKSIFVFVFQLTYYLNERTYALLKYVYTYYLT